MVTNLFAVEDKVKDQLEAANPEPIIEEVVSTCLSAVVSSSLYHLICPAAAASKQKHKIRTTVMLSHA